MGSVLIPFTTIDIVLQGVLSFKSDQESKAFYGRHCFRGGDVTHNTNANNRVQAVEKLMRPIREFSS